MNRVNRRALPGCKPHRKLKASFLSRARIKGFAPMMGFLTTMKNRTSAKPPAVTAEFDAKRSLLETFAINERANQKLIESISEAAWCAAPRFTSPWPDFHAGAATGQAGV